MCFILPPDTINITFYSWMPVDGDPTLWKRADPKVSKLKVVMGVFRAKTKIWKCDVIWGCHHSSNDYLSIFKKIFWKERVVLASTWPPVPYHDSSDSHWQQRCVHMVSNTETLGILWCVVVRWEICTFYHQIPPFAFQIVGIRNACPPTLAVLNSSFPFRFLYK